MNYSGILVMARPERIPEISSALNEIDGVEVFLPEEHSDRIVAVLEAENIKAETDLLQAVKNVHGVASAEMVYHYFEDDQESITAIPADLDALQGLAAVPQSLQDI